MLHKYSVTLSIIKHIAYRLCSRWKPNTSCGPCPGFPKRQLFFL